MHHERTRYIAEVGLAIALAGVLAFVKITLPWNLAGGSVSLSMLPIFIVALRRGTVAGLITGALFGIVDFYAEPFAIHPIQVMLDYGVGFAACGLAGLGARFVTRALKGGATGTAASLCAAFAVVGGAARLAASFVSGVVFFSENAGGQNVYLFSLVYNASYLVPSLIVCAAASSILVPALHRAVPTSPGVPLTFDGAV